MFIPPMEPRQNVRRRDRRAFRREVVLRVLPTILEAPKPWWPSDKSSVEFAFEVAEACLYLEERAAKGDE